MKAQKKFCFICLPTPTDTQGQQQGLDEIRAYVQQIKEYGTRCIFVMRSTVIPGTTRDLGRKFDVMVASNPEFLSEDTWEHDAIKPRIVVVGTDDAAVVNPMKALYKKVPDKRKVFTDTVTAETMKYALNTFGVTKVVWANAIYDACEVNGADYDVIRRAMHNHPWGSKHHLDAVHKGGRGAGGRCLPKDIEAFAKYANSDFLKMTAEINEGYLRKSKKK